jgi:parallel beta-helix repeat protein
MLDLARGNDILGVASKVFMTDEQRAPLLRMSKPFPVLILAALLAMAGFPGARAAVLVVSNTAASGPGSLQQAMLDALATNGLDTITFQLPATGGRTITPTDALPAITDAVIIDGTTQTGYVGKPLIEINGANAGATTDGFRVSAGNSTIRGLAINRFGGAGIHLLAPGGTNTIQGNYIGTDTNGTTKLGNGTGSTHSGGVWIDGSWGNLIGGLYPTNRNVISGNGGSGIYLQNCSGNTVLGNRIGTTAAGTAALGNSTNGVSLYNSAGNLIGGTSTAARNVISGNGWSGVFVFGSLSTGNLVQGNYIGTDTNGSVALPNAGDGITVLGASANTIGGAVTGAGNLLSGNSMGGLNMKGPGADGNQVQGNFIGTDASGRFALGNTFSGITILNGTSNLIGGATLEARNVISANKLAGVYLTTNAVGNVVQGNIVGLGSAGTNALGNTVNGVSIDSASFNSIGGPDSSARNIISGNTNHGIEIYNASATGNSIQGNYIGTSLSGQSALGNKACGLRVLSPGNTIGGSSSGAGNLISGNAQDGVFLDGNKAAGNLVQGNLIGTMAGGASALGNGRAGVGISGAPGNTIGGTGNAGNLLSANGDAGVYLISSGATGNLVQGNLIGTDITGTLALGNTYEGLYLERAPSNTIGGDLSGAGNLISGNKTRGIWLTNASWNLIQGNWVGTKRDGVTGLGNRYHSIECELGARNNTIGGAANAGNTIAFAQTVYAGVRIRNGSTNNTILGNSILSNGALGIDLGAVGTNSIFACGNGNGTNGNADQNYPVLVQAVSGNGTGIRGTLNGKPGRSFRLEFFASPACDGAGSGEGQIYLGQATVVTSNNCLAGFVANLPVPVPTGYVITATATDAASNTSEFSACRAVTPVPALAVSSVPLPSPQVALAWTNTATGFVLKETTSLSEPVQWITVTNAPVITNGHFVVILPATSDSGFFVLSFE